MLRYLTLQLHKAEITRNAAAAAIICYDYLSLLFVVAPLLETTFSFESMIALAGEDQSI